MASNGMNASFVVPKETREEWGTGDDNSNSSSSSSSSQRRLRLLRLVLCTTGICVCYLSYGLLHEHLFRNNVHDDKATSSLKIAPLGPSFVLLTQCITNVAVAILWQYVQAKRAPSSPSTTTTTIRPKSDNELQHLPHIQLIITSGCYVTAMVCSNEAIPYVSYPVQVLVKSCKLIPTMLVGQFVERRLYSTLEWMAALCITMGIVLFQYSRYSSSSSTNAATATDDNWLASMLRDSGQTYGMILLAGSLTMDGVLSSMQNIVKRVPRPPNAIETMLYVNLYAILFLFPLCLVTGQWQSAYSSLITYSGTYVGSLLLLNGTVALGQIFIFLTIAWFSPVTTTIITTTRKFMTILLSVYTYGHTFTLNQWCAVTMVFVGLYVAIFTTIRGSGDTNSTQNKLKAA